MTDFIFYCPKCKKRVWFGVVEYTSTPGDESINVECPDCAWRKWFDMTSEGTGE